MSGTIAGKAPASRGKRLRGDELFDQMEPGDWLHSPRRTVTEADVVMFSALTWDHNPAHTSAVDAAAGIFGERVAHGMLGVAFAIGLVPNKTVAGLRRLKHVTFKAPIRIGSTVRVEGTVAEMREYSDALGLVTGRWKLVDQEGTVLVKFEIDALWHREARDGDDR